MLESAGNGVGDVGDDCVGDVGDDCVGDVGDDTSFGISHNGPFQSPGH